MKLITHIENYIFEIEDFMSREECDRWIKWSEDHGYDEAFITTKDGAVRNEGVRNNDRIIYEDAAYAQELWGRVKLFVPEFFSGRQAIGLNEQFRFYRYVAGQKFDWHSDASFERENGEKSQFTFLIYLNSGSEGGATSFTSQKSPLVFKDFGVLPKKGTALLFFHPIVHRGDEVISGTKYVIRSDVMYAAKENDLDEYSIQEH